jgi:hypothetical protein
MSLYWGKSAPSYANAGTEQLFVPEIKRTDNDQQEETARGTHFLASSKPQVSQTSA